MAKEFDNLENEALRYGAGVPAGAKFRNLSAEQRQGFDNYMKTKIRRDPSVFENDPRAKKYLKDYDQSTFDQMRQQEIKDSVNPGAMWDDFGGASDVGVDSDFNHGQEYSPDQSNETQAREDQRDTLRDGENDEPAGDTGEIADEEAGNKSTDETPGDTSAPKGSGNVPGLSGSGPAAEGAELAGDAAGTAAKVAGGLGEAAEGAGAVAEGAGALGAGAAAGTAGAGAAAAGTAVAVESNPVGWVLTILAILGIIMLLVVGLTALSMKYPDTASAIIPTTSSSGARDKIVAEAEKELNAKVCGTGSNQNAGPPQKYTQYTCGTGSPSSGSSVAWCAGFAGWVYGHAGFSFPHTCGAKEMMDGLKYKYSIQTKIPKPGDMIQWEHNGTEHHIAIVYKIVGTTLYTIEGNAGACVSVHKYSNYGRGTWLRFGNNFEAE